MFLDEVTIAVQAGKGGSGCISLRREAHVPRGGPDGGHGGDGGNVILRANPNFNTLYHFKGTKLFAATNGEAGGSQLCTGHAGPDLVLDVPVGTMVFLGDEHIADLATAGETFLAARGGLGGKGNAGFKSATRQTPRFAELGEPGEARTLRLELRLVADVGIIGLPSVGKSTLISVISAARPKIAAYHFTTIVPNLGVVSHRDETFVVTDLPGLIKGASKGKGLGHQFLRHAERTRFFLHLVAADSPTVVTDYRTIRDELRKYDPALAEKPEIVVLSKADMLTAAELKTVTKKLADAAGKYGPVALKDKNTKAKIDILPLSAPLHEGLTELLDATLIRLRALREEERIATEAAALEMPVYRPHLVEKSRSFSVKRKNLKHYLVDGPRINQLAVMTDYANHEARARLFDIFQKFGIVRELTKLGAQPGAKVEIAGKIIEWWGE